MTRSMIKLHPDMNAVFWIYFLENSEPVVPVVSNSDNNITIDEPVIIHFKPRSKNLLKLNISEIL